MRNCLSLAALLFKASSKGGYNSVNVLRQNLILVLLFLVTNPRVYNRSIYKYNLIDVYKYNLIDACINVFLESLERKFMLAIFIHGNLV